MKCNLVLDVVDKCPLHSCLHVRFAHILGKLIMPYSFHYIAMLVELGNTPRWSCFLHNSIPPMRIVLVTNKHHTCRIWISLWRRGSESDHIRYLLTTLAHPFSSVWVRYGGYNSLRQIRNRDGAKHAFTLLTYTLSLCAMMMRELMDKASTIP